MVHTPYPKLIQDHNKSRVQLLEEFKNTPNAVLFATKSFWEGVDVKGNQLLQVIIYKLPFETPSDLIYSSKTQKIDQKYGKGKHWMKFTIPDACLKLKQGVGRLIRSTTDIGVIAILDARINYQNYGRIVINTLPNAYRTQKLDKVEMFYKKWNR
jgi:ATP-dependent DNA helicase DinG